MLLTFTGRVWTLDLWQREKSSWPLEDFLSSCKSQICSYSNILSLLLDSSKLKDCLGPRASQFFHVHFLQVKRNIIVENHSVIIFYVKRCWFLRSFLTLLVQSHPSIVDHFNMDCELVTNDTYKTHTVAEILKVVSHQLSMKLFFRQKNVEYGLIEEITL